MRNSTIDLCYGSVANAYRSIRMPPFGASYHSCVLLLLTYRSVCKRQERTIKTVKCWSEDSIDNFKACFDCTGWYVFYDSCSDLNELTQTVSSYISFCVDINLPEKNITVYSNNKPWVTKDLKNIINKKKKIFYTGNNQEKKDIKKEVKNEIRRAKRAYKGKVEQKYSSGDLRVAWRGIKSISSITNIPEENRKPIRLEGRNEDLPIAFNVFYLRFENHDLSDNLSALKQEISSDMDCNMVITQECVNNLLKRVNVRKASGPDGICGRTLKYCADQLSSVLHHIFQMSLNCSLVPDLWKSSITIPVPKNSSPKQLNDFRPVALTSLCMKVFEKVVKNIITSHMEGGIDPLQFAYQAGKGVDDAKLFILNCLYRHLEKPQAHARLLFADFSSAFNLMQLHLLLSRLISDFNLPHQVVLWLSDFLTDRKQRVLVNGCDSDSLALSTGSPQGCILSPLLFILYTDECRSVKKGSYLIKFLMTLHCCLFFKDLNQGMGRLLLILFHGATETT